MLSGFVITREDSYNSAIWQQIINRGANQSIEAQFWTGLQPGASVTLTTNGSYNGNSIIKNATLHVRPTDVNNIIGEEVGHYWYKPDPSGGGLATFIYNNNATQAVSDFWKTNVRIGLLYDPGVPPLKSANNGEETSNFDRDRK